VSAPNRVQQDRDAIEDLGIVITEIGSEPEGFEGILRDEELMPA
jgi:hypothetical protein